MRIYFSNLSVFNKNAKRIQYIIENLQFSDSKFDQAKDRIKLTSIKNHLAVAYGYNGLTEIAESLSDDTPQLKDLENDQLIEVENRISEEFAKYFQSLGISKRSSLCVSPGIDYYLRNQADDSPNKLRYQVNYSSYTELARKFGLTVPALKKHLVEKKAISDHVPTTKSLTSKRCKPIIFDFKDRGFGNGVKVMYLWDEKYVERSLKNKGVAPKSGFERYELPKGIHQADKFLSNIASDLFEIIKKKEKSKDKRERLDMEVMYIQAHPLAFWGAPKDRSIKTHLRNYFNNLLDAASLYSPGEMKKAEKSLNKLIEWIEYWHYRYG